MDVMLSKVCGTRRESGSKSRRGGAGMIWKKEDNPDTTRESWRVGPGYTHLERTARSGCIVKTQAQYGTQE